MALSNYLGSSDVYLSLFVSLNNMISYLHDKPSLAGAEASPKGTASFELASPQKYPNRMKVGQICEHKMSSHWLRDTVGDGR